MFHKTKEDKINNVPHYYVKYTSIGNVSSTIMDTTEVVETANNVATKSNLSTNKTSFVSTPTTVGLRQHRKMCIPKRYLITILAFVGYFLKFLIELNLGIAIVEMTSNKTSISNGNETNITLAEFNWTSVEKGVILSAASIGSVFAFISGPLIHKVGGAKIVGITCTTIAIIELTSPFQFVTNMYVFIIGRIFLGYCEGVSTAAFSDLFAHWSPPEERTRLISVAFTGRILSGAVNYPLSGYIAYVLGWREIFYISGTAMLVWSIIWLILVSNRPADDHILISDAEKNYLKNNNIASEKIAAIPWKKILTTKQVYALLNEFFSMAWCSSFIITCLPLYIKDTRNANTQDVGLLAGLPMLCNVITMPFAAFIVDYLRSGFFTPGQIHRIVISVGQLFVLVLLLVFTIWGEVVVSMVCFCLIRVTFGFTNTSYQVICIDMGGQYAGVLKSMAITCLSLGHFLNPVVLGYMTPNHTVAEWNWYFIFLNCISIYGIVVFLRVGAGDRQSWAESPKPDDRENHPIPVL